MKQGWEIKSLGEVADVEYGFTDKSTEEGDYRYVRITDIDNNGELISTEKKYLKYSKEAEGFLISDNDLLMARTGATFAKVLLYKDFEPSVFASYLIRIKFKEKIENKLYWYFTKTKSYWEQANSLASGAAQPHFNGAAVKQIMFPFPKSQPEQQRIVAILDETFAAIAKAKANAEQNLKNAKELFESYLQRVFENKGKDWKEKTLKEVCAKITDGTHQTPKYFDAGVIFLSSRNVTSGKIDWDKIRYIDEKQHLEMHKRVAPRVGDILLAKNGTTGVAAMVDRDLVFDIYVSLAHIRVLDEVTPDFMLYFVNSPIAKKQFNKRLKGSGVPNLHLEEIREVEISFPKSINEQNIIVQKLDSFSTETKRLEAIYQQKINDLEELKKSVLQKAFAGELTSSVSTNLLVTKVIPLQKIDGISTTDLQAGITALALQKHIEKNQQHSFHHVKAEKIVHLSEYILNIDLERNPVKDAAGPNDFHHAKKVESRAKKAGFYTVFKNGEYYDYQIGRSINSVIQKTHNCLGEKTDTLFQIIDILIPMNTQQAEIVATAYAAWNNLLLSNTQFTDEDIVTEARENWHKEKLKIPREKFVNAIEWMKKNELLIPKGNGKTIFAK